MRYSIEDFQDIESEGYIYELPPEALSLINQLSDMVGAPTYQKTPIFSKNVNPKKRNKNEFNDNEWKMLRNFKKTEIKKNQNNNINQVRILLNKLTTNNYDSMIDKIVEIIENIVANNKDIEAVDAEAGPEDDETVGEQIEKTELAVLCDFIFDIASTNKFYSELYAQLYFDLLKRYNILESIFRLSFNEFIKLFDNIETCSPNEDYDLFCKINKINDKRRAMGIFIINLMKKDIITKIEVFNIIINLQNMVEKDLDNLEMQVKIEELCENIYLMYTNSYSVIKDMNEYDDLFNKLVGITKLNVKDYKGLGNKVKFKYMDMVEYKK